MSEDESSEEIIPEDESSEEIIPGRVVMFSGCKDSQTSADVSNTQAFGLKQGAGPGGAGGACTNSMLKVLQTERVYSWVELLAEMRAVLSASEYEQIPMLSTSRRINLSEDFSVINVNATATSKKRAVLVGINYVGTDSELAGCHNDVETMKRYLEKQGYEEESMRILMDKEGAQYQPTAKQMTEAMKWLLQGAQAGDSLFFHYSGHGTSIDDDDGDEADGMDEALCPVDYDHEGFLRDDDIYKYLVGPLPKGASMVCVLDCCHSGTILDLPFQFRADRNALVKVSEAGSSAIAPNNKFNAGKFNPDALFAQVQNVSDAKDKKKAGLSCLAWFCH